MIERLLTWIVLPLYLSAVFVLWFFTTDYLGEVPTRFADDFELIEIRDEIRSHFYRDYIFKIP